MKKFKVILISLILVACGSDSADDGYGSSNYNGNGNYNNGGGDSSDSNNSTNSFSISVTASGSSDYNLSGSDRDGSVSGQDPNIKFKKGDKITFSVNASGHPFYIKTQSGTGTANQASGVTNNGTGSGNVVWQPSASGTYYYVCSLHGSMYGVITIVN